MNRPTFRIIPRWMVLVCILPSYETVKVVGATLAAVAFTWMSSLALASPLRMSPGEPVTLIARPC